MFRHSCLPVFAWRRVLLHIFDPKQLLRVSCILWCFYPKCYSIILIETLIFTFCVIKIECPLIFFILGLYALAIGTLAMSAPFPYYMEVLQHMHIATPLIFSLKFALAWSFFYHTANGIRHLVCIFFRSLIYFFLFFVRDTYFEFE